MARHHGARLIALVTAVATTLALGGCDLGRGPLVRTTVAVSPLGRHGTTLVLYDTSGQYGALGELYAIQVKNLASHFGTVTAHPATGYRKGEDSRYTATVYIGSSYGEPLPTAFLDDVAAAHSRILWINENYWQVTARHPDIDAVRGFTVGQPDDTPVTQVRYRGVDLTRDLANTAGVARLTVRNPAVATAVAEAVHADGSTVPWGVRSGNLTYLGEIPFAYLGPDDRYLAFADLLFDLLAPTTPVRHRALVRIEDVGPNADPAQLRAVADFLASRKIPFSVAVFAEYDDPAGRYSGGTPVHLRMRDAPAVVAALKYMIQNGGTLIAHGYTHQYAGGPNPYGVSAGDFEYYKAHLAADDTVVLDGPVPEDSAAWASGRLADARAEWAAAGLPRPDIFEFPHYAAGPIDYQTISAQVTARYERAMYYAGSLSGTTLDPTRYASQFFPYPVRDVYGAAVIPESLGNVETQGFNQHEARLPAQILESARRQLVIRDGVASFFYHPFLGTGYLAQLVEGVQALGYTFAPASDMILQP